MKIAHVRSVFLALLIPAFAGCAANQPKPPPPPSYSQLIQQADARMTAQDFDGAKVLYTKAAAADPARETPWYRLAKINFDQQNYGSAIVNAQEALRRDPTDSKAESILTIAGLRVAVQALGRLHDESNEEGPAHVEAEKLAAAMRETLGQDVLVPPKPKPVKRHVRRRVEHHEAPPASAPAKPAPNGNPFDALPGSSSGH